MIRAIVLLGLIAVLPSCGADGMPLRPAVGEKVEAPVEETPGTSEVSADAPADDADAAAPDAAADAATEAAEAAPDEAAEDADA